LGKSKSTDTEEEEAEEDYGDDGKMMIIIRNFCKNLTFEVCVSLKLLEKQLNL